MTMMIVSTFYCQTKEEFDPSRLKDIAPKWPRINHSFMKYKTASLDSSIVDTSLKEMDGFKVQVFASRFSHSADSLKAVLDEKVDEQKLTKISHAIHQYQKETEQIDDFRIDCVSVILQKKKPIIKHFEGILLD